GEAPVVELDLVVHAALAAEAEEELAASHAHLAFAQRREAERGVLPRVLLVADADARGLEQAHHGGKHFLARQTGKGEVAAHLPPDARQRASEGDHPAVLVFVARFAPARVIAVL